MESLLPKFARASHASHVKRFLSGLPGSQVEVDSSRLALGFYCIGALDLLGALQSKTTETDRNLWREWIWEQQTHGPHGSGFRPSPFATPDSSSPAPYTDYDGPHLVMTYTALLTLAILRDDFSKLDRPGLVKFIRTCQRDDGSFSIVPRNGDTDLRTLYCAFCICDMLDDWSGMDVERAVKFIGTCRVNTTLFSPDMTHHISSDVRRWLWPGVLLRGIGRSYIYRARVIISGSSSRQSSAIDPRAAE
ncbi:terpenoid cyclases/protein prenyltransferase alpha-alpha toroid [Mycena belliarum]|uniref:Terpenoid cyclases/protein prenyltransferase alpha-alpha toroid n=1 Tax=Mycena belliarum TaxID=1033014 RepID=A0AAD6XT74_9AGAR|nr:terpenoid cyclases/protein prenyltransferase alpha-alpha toroid [Mycena belliae]